MGLWVVSSGDRAGLFSLVTYWLFGQKIRDIAKMKLRWWHLTVSVLMLIILLLLSMKIVLDLPPETWFIGQTMTRSRFVGTLIFYWLFAINLGVVVALIERLAPRPRRGK